MSHSTHSLSTNALEAATHARASVCLLRATRYQPPADAHSDGLEGGEANEDANAQMSLPVEICLTSMECARFKVSGIDVDALHAKAKAVSVEGHRRALQMAESGCTDTTPFKDALVAVINEAGIELEGLALRIRAAVDNMTHTDDIGSGEDAEEEGEVGNMTSEDLGSRRLFQLPGLQRRRLGDRPRSPSSNLMFRYLVRSGVVEDTAATAFTIAVNQWRELSVPAAAESSACSVTKSKVDILRDRLDDYHSNSEDLEERLEQLADQMEDVVTLNDRLRQARSALSIVGRIVDLIRTGGGPIRAAGTMARPILDLFEDNVDTAYNRLNPFVNNYLVDSSSWNPPAVRTTPWRLQQRVEDIRRHNNNARSEVEKVNDTFHHYAYPCYVDKARKEPQEPPPAQESPPSSPHKHIRTRACAHTH